MTGHVNTLTRLLVGKELDGVTVCLPPMKRAFEELEDAHYDYLDMFEMYDDDIPSDDVNQCERWFVDVSKSYLDVISKARMFLARTTWCNNDYCMVVGAGVDRSHVARDGCEVVSKYALK